VLGPDHDARADGAVWVLDDFHAEYARPRAAGCCERRECGRDE
jgi:hypothetical protein